MTRWTIAAFVVFLGTGVTFHLSRVGRLTRERDSALASVHGLEEELRELRDLRAQRAASPSTGPTSIGASGSEPGAGESVEAEAGAEATAEAVEARVAEAMNNAREAIEGARAEAFLDAVFSLIDLGPQGHLALAALLNEVEIEKLGEIGKSLEGSLATRAKLLGGLFLRVPALDAAIGTLLDRGGALDNASLMALSLMTEHQVPITDAEARVASIRSLIAAALESEGSEEPERLAAAIRGLGIEALAKSGDPSAVAALESLYRLDPDKLSWRVPSAIARIGGEESVEALARLYREADPEHSAAIVRGLSGVEGETANRELWSLLELEGDAMRQRPIWQSLASRPENVEAMVDVLRSPDTDERVRSSVLYSLRAGSPDETREVLWGLHDTTGRAETQDAILSRLVYSGDDRASHAVVDRVVAGGATGVLQAATRRLDREVVASRRDDLYAAAADSRRKIDARVAAARVIARVDREEAVSALLVDYGGLAEPQRLGVVSSLTDSRLRGGNAQSALARIAETDASPRVRDAAQKSLGSR